MTIALIAAAVLMPQGAPTPGKLISDMLAKYNSAKTVSGTIGLSQSAGQQGGTLGTTIHFERPGKLYIHQRKTQPAPKEWLVVSDGKLFSYDEPDRGDAPRKRLMESMTPLDRMTQKKQQLTIKEVYAAAALSLGDRSAPLDILISRPQDLQAIRLQWVNLKYSGETEINGEKLHVIEGDWKEYGDAPVSGKFRMLLSHGSDLRQYAISENFRINGAVTQVVSIWNVNVAVDGSVDQALFKP
jgi:outer membrane lipoprotein-sorting protein